ncbi:DUF4387 family protein [Caulobacter sp. SLTY]|uniref:DUF4387 domain-containing protein n=1 Tax=Caulobacter sp. SLTY TaxID=2683262 RepID=UPI001412A698|nr:DUF4387 domain-containing protein [Caulobacter sp. SLTY]NBB14777.1 DUF4387 family protein [Caulobacter sp. SLTY]
MSPLKDVARYVRSKNAGPFWVTIDVFCDDRAAYERLCAAPALGAVAIADLYGVGSNQVRIFHDDNLKVLKISFPRPIAQGSTEDVDSHAGQQFVPLLSVMV